MKRIMDAIDHWAAPAERLHAGLSGGHSGLTRSPEARPGVGVFVTPGALVHLRPDAPSEVEPFFGQGPTLSWRAPHDTDSNVPDWDRTAMQWNVACVAGC